MTYVPRRALTGRSCTPSERAPYSTYEQPWRCSRVQFTAKIVLAVMCQGLHASKIP